MAPEDGTATNQCEEIETTNDPWNRGSHWPGRVTLDSSLSREKETSLFFK